MKEWRSLRLVRRDGMDPSMDASFEVEREKRELSRRHCLGQRPSHDQNSLRRRTGTDPF